MRTLALAALLALPGSQEPAPSPDASETTGAAPQTWLHCGALLAQPGQEPLRGVTVIVEGSQVLELREGYATPPPDADPAPRVLDLRARFVLPGLIDCHTHLSNEYSADVALRQVQESDADRAIAATVFARRTLAAGFTVVRNLGSSGDVVFALRDAIAAGRVPGPRILAAGNSITPSGGHGDDTHGYREDLLALPGPAQGVADGADACRRAVRLQVKRGADVIKLTATGGVLSQTDAGTGQQFFTDELEAIVQTARSLGRRVAAHAHGAGGIHAALRAGVDSIEHGSYLDDQAIELFLESGAFLVPTLLAGETVVEWAQDERTFPAVVRAKALAVGPVMRASLGRAAAAGVRIAFGTDSGVSAHGQNHREFLLMEAAGMSPMDCLVSATRGAAELCGLEASHGFVGPGAAADLVALEGDPLEDLTAMGRVDVVLKAGTVAVRGGQVVVQ